MSTPQLSNVTPLWPLAPAATLAGMSVRAFVKGVNTEQIPCPILQIGRLRFVRRADLVTWLYPKQDQAQPANADLFE